MFSKDISPKNALSYQSKSNLAEINLSFFNVAFKMFCLAGFLYQMIQISIAYFAFKTNTKIVFELDNNFINPSITFRVRYPAIVDRTKNKTMESILVTGTTARKGTAICPN